MPLVEHADEADEFCHIGQGDGAQDAHVHSRVAIEDEILHLLADITCTRISFSKYAATQGSTHILTSMGQSPWDDIKIPGPQWDT